MLGDILKVDTNGLGSFYALLQSGSIVFKGSTGKDVFTGYDHDDGHKSGAGNDVLDGGRGDDLIQGGAGNDKLTAGAGADTFIFAKGDGKDTIADFEAGKHGTDVLEFGRTCSTAMPTSSRMPRIPIRAC